MSRSDLFSKLKRTIRIARFADAKGLSSKEAVQRAEAIDVRRRRMILAGGAAVAASAVGTMGCAVDADASGIEHTGATRSALPRASGTVGIIGAGLAGL